MPLSSRRASVAVTLGALVVALALPGQPAVAAPTGFVPNGSYTVEKTGGIVQLSDSDQVEAVGTELFDSRLPWSATAGADRLGPQRTLTIDLRNAPVNVPSDATAMILNVTAIAPTRPGWLTVWPSDRARPTASTLNYAPGTPTPNLAVVTLSASRKLTVMNGSTGSTHLRVTFEGWVRSNGRVQKPGSVTATNGVRVIDTRTAGHAVPAKGYRDITVAGHGVPSGAAAALLDVIAVRPSRAGYLIAHPSDTPRPNTTALTYRVGGDRAALSVMRLSSSGKVRVWNMSSAPVHLVVDSFGWVAAGDSSSTPAGLAALTPVRVLDSRGTQSVSSRSPVAVPVPGDDRTAFAGRPSGVVLSITTTNATASGHLFLDVDGNTSRNPGWYSQSVANFAPGETATNTAFVTVPSAGRLRLQTNTGQVDAIVDVVGVVRHRSEVAGRLITEANGTPVHPGVAGQDIDAAMLRVPTSSTGRYQHTRGDIPGPAPICGTAVLPTGELDPTWARACLGGVVSPTQLTFAVGSRLVASDIFVPRVGSASGQVHSPLETSPSGSLMVLQRTDEQYLISASIGSDGRWQMPYVPTGTYVALLRGKLDRSLIGEAVHDLPLDVSGNVSSPVRLARLLDAGARTFTVTAGTTRTVDDAMLQKPGTVTGVVEDPDGNRLDVAVEWRHESGYLLTGGAWTSALMTQTVRPGGWVLCATEAGVTRCSGGAPSFAEATPVEVTPGGTVTTTITLP